MLSASCWAERFTPVAFYPLLQPNWDIMGNSRQTWWRCLSRTTGRESGGEAGRYQKQQQTQPWGGAQGGHGGTTQATYWLEATDGWSSFVLIKCTKPCLGNIPKRGYIFSQLSFSMGRGLFLLSFKLQDMIFLETQHIDNSSTSWRVHFGCNLLRIHWRKFQFQSIKLVLFCSCVC